MKLKRFLIISLIFITIVYLTMVYDTNSLIRDFKNVVNNSLQENVSYGKMKRYLIPTFEEQVYRNTDLKIKRIFVLHNFKKGVMYVKYSYIAYDTNDELITGSSDVISKWYIEKKNNRWKVVDIEERP